MHPPSMTPPSGLPDAPAPSSTSERGNGAIAMASRLVSPPYLRVPGGDQERHTTWLELFYDLVFVVAVGAVSERLIHDLDPIGVVRFVALFLPVWWAWLGHTVYDGRFDTDDVVQRLWTFGIMLSAAAMALAIPRAFEGWGGAFAAAYVGARLSLLALYLRAHRHVEAARAITRLYLAGFGVGAALWALSIPTHAPARYVLWAAGLAVDFATPWLGRPVLQRAPLDASHLPERFGAFVIILLGEIIVVIVEGASASALRPANLVAALLAFALAASIWWIYFSFLEAAPFADKLGSGQPYMYAHLPMFVGLALVSVGLEHAEVEATAPTLPAVTRCVFAAGIVLWLGAGVTLKRISTGAPLPPSVRARYIATIVGVLALAVVGGVLPPLVALGGTVLIVGAQVAFEVHFWAHWAEQGSARAEHAGLAQRAHR
jgi:low temperature requirement protein LtrA